MANVTVENEEKEKHDLRLKILRYWNSSIFDGCSFHDDPLAVLIYNYKFIIYLNQARGNSEEMVDNRPPWSTPLQGQIRGGKCYMATALLNAEC